METVQIDTDRKPDISKPTLNQSTPIPTQIPTDVEVDMADEFEGEAEINDDTNGKPNILAENKTY